MRTNLFLLALMVVAGLAMAARGIAADKTAPKTWNFEDAAVDRLPEGWSEAKTGTGPGSVWKIQEDSSAPSGPKVLAQTSTEGPKPLFNLCVADGPRLADVDLTVAFKAVRGRIDQGGGLVWRYQDAKNYYVARGNPLEANLRVYRLVDGKRTQLKSSDIEVPAKQWHKLRIVHKGDHIQCYLNGELEIDVKDDAIKEPGKVGLWTKADAVTSFDGLVVQ